MNYNVITGNNYYTVITGNNNNNSQNINLASPPPTLHIASVTTPEQPPLPASGFTWSEVKRDYLQRRGKQGPITSFAMVDKNSMHLASPDRPEGCNQASIVDLTKVKTETGEKLLHSGVLHSLVRDGAGRFHVSYVDIADRVLKINPQLNMLYLLDTNILIDLVRGESFATIIADSRPKDVSFAVTETVWAEVKSVQQRNKLRDQIFPEYGIVLLNTKLDRQAGDEAYDNVCSFLSVPPSPWVEKNRSDFHIFLEACIIRKALEQKVSVGILSDNLRFCGLLKEKGVKDLAYFQELGIDDFPTKKSCADLWNHWFRYTESESACNRCAGYGHYFAACPSPALAMLKENQLPECSLCFGYGHQKDICPLLLDCLYCKGRGHTQYQCFAAEVAQIRGEGPKDEVKVSIS